MSTGRTLPAQGHPVDLKEVKGIQGRKAPRETQGSTVTASLDLKGFKEFKAMLASLGHKGFKERKGLRGHRETKGFKD